MRDLESIRELSRPLADRIGDGDDLATIIALKAGNVSQRCPVTGAKNSNSNRQGSLLRRGNREVRWEGPGMCAHAIPCATHDTLMTVSLIVIERSRRRTGR